jgi:hypothetical protein
LIEYVTFFFKNIKPEKLFFNLFAKISDLLSDHKVLKTYHSRTNICYGQHTQGHTMYTRHQSPELRLKLFKKLFIA